MTDHETPNMLAESLEWIEKTGESIHEAAARFPDHSEELEKLLQTYELLENSEKLSPTTEFKAAARTRMINRINALEKSSHSDPVTKPGIFRLIWQNENGTRRFAMRWLLTIGLIVSLIGGGGGTVYASNISLPGDMLYPLKTGLQDLELAFSGDSNDIELLLENMAQNINEMQQLATRQRYSDILIGLEEFEGNLQALNQTRARVSYEDAGTEESLNTRIQQQLQTHAQLLDQLRDQTRDQLKLQERLQQAIQLTEQGHTYGPNEGGQPAEPGSPNGAGPGEPQGPQNGAVKPEEAGSEGGQGDPGDGSPGNSPGSGGNGGAGTGNQNQNSFGNGDGSCTCFEENLFCVIGEVQNEYGEVVDAVCTCQQTSSLCGEGETHNQAGPGEGGSGSGQGGKP
jgi:hypothetical protein